MTSEPIPRPSPQHQITTRHGEVVGIEAVIFDKDGTLLDFHASWDEAVGRILDQLAADAPEAKAQAASALGYDLDQRRVLPGSAIIAESNDRIVELIRPAVGHLVPGDLTTRFNQLVAEVGTTMVAEAEGATAALQALAERGLRIGLATNDAEAVARSQLDHLRWTPVFGAIVGYDSGFGAKPKPGMILGCAQKLAVEAASCVMIGDSPHDLIAARAAGAVPVMIGDNPAALPHADVRIATLAELVTRFEAATS